MKWRCSVVLVALILAPACALPGHHGYSTLDAVACGTVSVHESQLVVILQDEEHAPIPALTVHAIQADAGPGTTPFVRGATTDSLGRAVLTVPTEKRWSSYAIVAAFVGFYPQVRLVNVEAGCSGRVRILLRVVSGEIISDG